MKPLSIKVSRKTYEKISEKTAALAYVGEIKKEKRHTSGVCISRTSIRVWHREYEHGDISYDSDSYNKKKNKR